MIKLSLRSILIYLALILSTDALIAQTKVTQNLLARDRLNLKLGLVTMRWKLFIEFCLTALIISILAGDLFLPQPYRSQTQQIRVDLNHFLLTLLPRQTIIDIQKKSDRHS